MKIPCICSIGHTLQSQASLARPQQPSASPSSSLPFLKPPLSPPPSLDMTILHIPPVDASTLLNSSSGFEVLSGLKTLIYRFRQELASATTSATTSSDSDEYDSDASDASSSSSSSSSGSEEEAPEDSHIWKEDTANYNVPFVGTKVLSSSASDSPLPPWTLHSFLFVSPQCYEILGPDLFPSSTLHTKTLNKTKKLRRLSNKIKCSHLTLLSLLCKLLAVLPPSPQTAPLPTLLKKSLLRGQYYKTLIQCSSTSTNSKTVTVASHNLLAALTLLFSKPNSPASFTPPYNVRDDIIGRLELSCSLQAGNSPANADNNNRASLTGAWLYRLALPDHAKDEASSAPEEDPSSLPSGGKKLPSLRSHQAHSVTLSTLSLLASLLSSLPNDASLKPLLLGSRGNKGFIATGITKALSLCRQLKPNSVYTPLYLAALTEIFASLTKTLQSLPTAISSADITNHLLPKQTLTDLISISSTFTTSPPTFPPPASHPLPNAAFSLLLHLISSPTSPYLSPASASPYTIKNASRQLTHLSHTSPYILETLTDIFALFPQAHSHYLECYRAPQFDTTLSLQTPALPGDAEIDFHGSDKQNQQNQQRIQDKRSVTRIINTFIHLTAILNLPHPASHPQHLYPPSLNKKLLTKAILHSDSLLLHSTVDLLTALLTRVKNSTLPTPTERLLRTLPDVQSLITIKSKFDAFKAAESSPLNDNICFSFLQLMEAYTLTLGAAAYDFTKLLPPTAAIFFSRPPPLQNQLVATLHAVATTSLGTMKWSKAALTTLLQIAAAKDAPTPTHELACAALRTQESDQNDETEACIQYESTCYLSLLTSDAIISTFTKVVDNLAKNTIHFNMLPAKCHAALHSSTTFPSIPFSNLLTACLVAALKSEGGDEWRDFVAGVCGRMIRFMADPALLCVCIEVLGGEAEDEAASALVAKAAAVMAKKADSTLTEGLGFVARTRELLHLQRYGGGDMWPQLEALLDEHEPEKTETDAKTELAAVDSIFSLATHVPVTIVLKSLALACPDSLLRYVNATYLAPAADFETIASLLPLLPSSSPLNATPALITKLAREEKKESLKIVLQALENSSVRWDDVDASALLGIAFSSSDEDATLRSLCLTAAELLPLPPSSLNMDVVWKYSVAPLLARADLNDVNSMCRGKSFAELSDAFIAVIAENDRITLTTKQLKEVAERMLVVKHSALSVPEHIRSMWRGLAKRGIDNPDLKGWLDVALAAELKERSKQKLSSKQRASERDIVLVASQMGVAEALFARVCACLSRELKSKEFAYAETLVQVGEAALSCAGNASEYDTEGLELVLLKNGMKEDADEKLSGLLLGLGSSLVAKGLGLEGGELLTMIVSHSNYDSCTRNVGVLKLIKECLEKSEKELSEEEREGLFKSLMAVHTAGIEAADVQIRAVVEVLSRKHGGSWAMDELRWGGGEGGGEGAYGMWTWLFSIVDDRRVKATVGGLGEGAYDVEFVLSLCCNMLEEFVVEEERERPPDRRVRGGEDSMEVDGEDGGGEEDEDEDEYEEERLFFGLRADNFVALTKRFFDCGVVAMAMAGLAEAKTEVRKVALVVLCMVHKGVEMREAKRLAGWAARPQLGLVVGSLLRGLGRRMRMNDEGGGDDRFFVPRFPAVTSVFLARSLLVLGAGGRNNMYASVNTYFLRQKTGAFVDTNTVPNFNHMFNSSSETREGAKIDRLWILKVLEDGVQGALDFKAAQRR